jgi:hypothetical protein
VDAKLLASQVAIEQLIRTGGLAEQVKGPVTVSADLRTSGSSIAAFIEGLAGSGSFEGSLTPLASVQRQTGDALLDALGGQTKQVRGLTDVVASALAAFAGRPSALTGSFVAREGVLTTRDARLENPQAQARSRGTLSLSAWSLDMTTDVHRPRDQIAPYMTIHLTGRLDAPNVRLSGSAFSGRRGDSRSGGPVSPQSVPPGGLGGTFPQILPAPASQLSGGSGKPAGPPGVPALDGNEGLGGLFDTLRQRP